MQHPPLCSQPPSLTRTHTHTHTHIHTQLKKAEDALAQLLEEQDQYDGEELSRQLREAAMAKKEAREASSAIRPKVTQIEQARHRHTREFARLSGKLKRMKVINNCAAACYMVLSHCYAQPFCIPPSLPPSRPLSC